MRIQKACVAGLSLALVISGCGKSVGVAPATSTQGSGFESASVLSLFNKKVKDDFKAGFDTVDVNQDGAVDHQEAPFLSAEDFKGLDHDGDGRITFTESLPPATELSSQVNRLKNEFKLAFTAMDANGNGLLEGLETADVPTGRSGSLTPDALLHAWVEADANPGKVQSAANGPKRNAVLMLPGCTSPKFIWIPIELALKKRGYTHQHVLMAWPWLGDIRGYAWLAKREFDKLKAESPTGKVDMMAHSMGGLIGRSMLRQFGGTESVDHFITYGTPHHGSVLGHLVGFLFTAIKEMTPGSEFLTELNEQEELTPNIKRFAIKANFDELVIPHSSAEWRGAPVRTIETSAHLLLIDHPLAVKWGMEDLEQ